MQPFSRVILPVLRPLVSLLPVDLLISLTQQKLLLPAYHLISNEDVPHVKHLYPVRNEKLFRSDLDFFLKHYEPISFAHLIETAYGRKKITKPSFFLSFDDGLSEVYHIIAPILKQKGIPAAFYINSAFADNKDLFFRYKASLLAERIQNTVSEVQQEMLGHLFSNQNFGSADLMKVNYAQRHLLDKAADILQISFAEYLKTKKPYLNTGQIAALQKDGFTIGAHSADHPEYRFISLSEQLAQTTSSIDFVQQQFNPAHNSFAFPFTDYGVSKLFFETIEKNKIAELTFGCAGLKREQFPFHLQRVPIDNGLAPAKNSVISEYLYYLLKAPFNRNVITRN